VKVIFSGKSWDQYTELQLDEPKVAARLNVIIRDAMRSPFRGLGKPEPLRDTWRGWWSRRITDEHRLIYRITGSGDDQRIEIAQCRYHY